MYEFWEGTAILQLWNCARYVIQRCIFWILQAFVCSLPVELDDNSCPWSRKVQLKNSTKFHVREMESFSRRTLLYFMSTNWKSFTGEICDAAYPPSGKVYLGNLAIFHVQEVEHFTWRTLRYFMSTKWKSLTGEIYYIL